MVDVRKDEPNGSSKQATPPPLFSQVKCPNCGRERAIVFRLIRDYPNRVEDAPLVCMECCLESRLGR